MSLWRTNGSLRPTAPDDDNSSLLPTYEWSMELEDFLPRSVDRESAPGPDPMAILEYKTHSMSMMAGRSKTTIMTIPPSLPPRIATIHSPKSKRVRFDLRQRECSTLATIPEETIPDLSDKFKRLRFNPLPPLPPQYVHPESDP